MTEGILAGPFGNPYGFEGGNAKGFAQFPRAISIPRTSYSIVGQSVKGPGVDKSVAWFATDQPMTSVYVPLLAKVESEAGIDDSYKRGSLWEFDRESAFWAFDFVSNWMNINWRNSSTEEVMPLQKEIQDEIDFKLAELWSQEAEETDVISWQRELQKSVVSRWWKLADRLIVKYNDGYYTRVGSDLPAGEPPIIGKSYGYPDWFSKMIGQSTDIHPVWVQPWDPKDGGSNGKAAFEGMKDISSLPNDIYNNDYKYQVPHIFDFDARKWIMGSNVSAASAAIATASSGNNLVTIFASLVIGFSVGYYMSSIKKEQKGGTSSPLLG
jgi:hypothetical protein